MRIVWTFIFLIFLTQALLAESNLSAMVDSKDRALSLDKCIEIALENNRLRSASKYAIDIAEAQHKQALSTFSPQLMLRTVYTLMDEDPIFLFPSFNMAVPPLKLGSLNIELPPIAVPEQEITLMNRQNLINSFNLVYPLFSGGMISSIRNQTQLAIEIAKEEAKRTDLQVIYDVKRYYYAVILARKILEIGEEALARLEVTLELTENLYQRGSGRVKKTDYLKNKIIVDNVRSFIASLKNNEELAKAALVNSMGLNWGTPIQISAEEIPFKPYLNDVNKFISFAYQFNPEWMKVKIAWKVFKAKVSEAKSGYFPNVALMGSLNLIENSYDFGIVAPENKQMWTIGIGLQFPIFSGFRIKNEIREAQARLDQLEEQEILLREGLALQIQHIVLQMATAQQQEKTLREALSSATENRSLTERAYQQELLEEKDLIESQIIESIMKAQYQKILYDHFEAQAHLDFVVGKVVNP